MGVGGTRHAPAAVPTAKTSGTHFIGCRVGAMGRAGWVQKISSPPGFDPRIVQPVENRQMLR